MDGGYFDNDSISTAVEFMQQIFPSLPLPRGPGHATAEAATTAPSPVHALPDEILFIEIVMAPTSPLRTTMNGSNWHRRRKSWNPGSRLAVPPLGFWRAGHSTVTRRNRRELQLLMIDLEARGDAHFIHIVLGAIGRWCSDYLRMK